MPRVLLAAHVGCVPEADDSGPSRPFGDSFTSLSTAPDIVVKVFATGLAVGILVDAVIVRTLLVPALVQIMGRWNWWMPSGLVRPLRSQPRPASAVRR
jgi:RND superfamily putative drug exporter